MTPELTESNQEAPEVLTAEQVADILQLSPGQVRRLARTGELPGRRIGGSWRFSRARVLALVGDAA